MLWQFNCRVVHGLFAWKGASKREKISKEKTLQKILGHSNIGITMNLYVHITEDEKQREIDLVADALKVVYLGKRAKPII